jgi:hypothetical protein
VGGASQAGAAGSDNEHVALNPGRQLEPVSHLTISSESALASVLKNKYQAVSPGARHFGKRSILTDM